MTFGEPFLTAYNGKPETSEYFGADDGALNQQLYMV